MVGRLGFSRIIFGLWRAHNWGYSDVQFLNLLHRLVNAGITSVDLADVYGHYTTEQRLGDVLRYSPELRNRMQFITKCGVCQVKPARPDNWIAHYNLTARHIQTSVERSLVALGVDRIDLLLLHRPDILMDADETASVLDKLVDDGKIAQLGVSNFPLAKMQLLRSRLKHPLWAHQIKISLLTPEALEDGDLDYLQQHKITPMAWSPLGGGELLQPNTEKAQRVLTQLECLVEKINSDCLYDFKVTPEQIALAWLMKHPAKIFPVIGSGKVERILSLAQAEKMSLTHQEWYSLLRAASGKDVD